MKKCKRFKEITQRFCKNLGDNAIIVRMVDKDGEKIVCLSSETCNDCTKCEHNVKKGL